jgi:hypothetical protein
VVSVVTHVPLLSQQPLQLEALHPEPLVHAPATHVCDPVQMWQVPPFSPHAAPVFAGWMQKPLGAQHPPLQLLELHALWEFAQMPVELQTSEPEHAEHNPPPTPHADVAFPGSHRPAEVQHPLQVLALHCGEDDEQAARESKPAARERRTSVRADMGPAS